MVLCSVGIFVGIFSILLYMLLYCDQGTMLTLYCQLLNYVMEKLLSSQTTWSATRTLQSTTSRSKTLVNLWCPPLTNYPVT